MKGAVIGTGYMGKTHIGILKNIVDGALLPCRKLKAKTLGKGFHFLCRNRIIMHACLFLPPFDDFKGGNEGKILFKSDTLGRVVLCLMGRGIMHLEIRPLQIGQVVLFNNLPRNNARKVHLLQRLFDRRVELVLGI